MANGRVSVADSTFKVEKKAFLRLCEGIDTPRALACSLLARNDEWGQYLDLPDPVATSADSFADDYLVTEIMTKNPRLPLGVDRKQVALDKFFASEKQCADTNRRFRSSRGLPEGPTHVHRIVRRARRIIARTLGDLTRRDLNSITHRARFGPGATSDVTGRAVVLSRKYSSLGATPRLRGFWTLLPRMWLEASAYKIHAPVYASRVTTVPKNAKTDRTICIEPHLNIFVQLGIAGLLRQRLKRCGIDLSTQEWNRFLASRAEEWRLATLDLSSASDLISEAIVEYFIPKRWLHLLRMARTEYTTLEAGGELIPLQKWSSMGNGYTFELETLIFWALAKAASAPGSITMAYGDDIICPQDAVVALVDTLEYCGFSVNWSKSCPEGTFFESCGSDWFAGQNVRAIYFRAEVDTEEDATDALLLYANQIRRWAYRRNGSDPNLGCDARLYRAWLMLRDHVPRRWQLFIPDGTGDGGLVGNFDEAVPRYSTDWQCRYFIYRTRQTQRRKPSNGLGYLLSRLHTPVRESSHHSEPEWLGRLKGIESSLSIRRKGSVRTRYFSEDVRGSGGKPHEAVGLPSGWPDLGPWC